MRRLVFFFAVTIIFTAAVACTNNQNSLEQNAITSLKIQARTVFDREVLYRRWNSTMVGVYAIKQGTAKPNPFLSPERREATTSTGLELVLINPAYMTRLVSEMNSESGIITKITSTMPINPNNKADDWEYNALKRMENREFEEFAEVLPMTYNGETKKYMRFIRQLITEPSCISCHPDYKEGDIRGGISVSIPVEPTMNAMKKAL